MRLTRPARIATGVLAAALLAVSAGGAGVEAAVGYPPTTVDVTLSPGDELGMGQRFEAEVSGCPANADVRLELAGETTTERADDRGDVVVSLLAPPDPGDYELVVFCNDAEVARVPLVVVLVESLPPSPDVIEVSNASPRAGSSFTVRVAGCEPGQTVTVDFAGTRSSAVVGVTAPTFTLVAPAAGGRFDVVVACDGVPVGSIRIDVVGSLDVAPDDEPGDGGGTIPSVGSGSTADGLMVGGGLLATGLGLLLVSRVRMRQRGLADV